MCIRKTPCSTMHTYIEIVWKNLQNYCMSNEWENFLREITKSHCTYVRTFATLNVDGLMMLNPQWFWNSSKSIKILNGIFVTDIAKYNMRGLRKLHTVRTNYYTKQCYKVKNYFLPLKILTISTKTSVAKSNCVH